jgi:hypothetical protein
MNYHTTYYQLHAKELNEKRLMQYYRKKLGEEYVKKMIESHGAQALDELKKASKRITKLQKIEKTIQHFETLKNNI